MHGVATEVTVAGQSYARGVRKGVFVCLSPTAAPR